MADIVLKDENGADVTYEGIETVTFDTTTEGVQATYVESSLIPEQVQSDWAQEDDTAVDYIKNKPAAYVHPETHDAGMIVGLAAVATSGSYQDLADQPDLSQVGKQSDWAQEDASAVDFIKNKPFSTEKVDVTHTVYEKTYNSVGNEDGYYFAQGLGTTATWTELPPAGQVCRVSVAGDTHRLVAWTVEGATEVFFGNPALFDLGEDDGTPFCLMFAPKGSTLVMPEWSAGYANVLRMKELPETPFDVAVAVVDGVEEVVHRLERKYLPDIPAFDLGALGLGAVAVGGSASAEFDTSELMAALGQGPVKLTLTVNAGAAEQVSVVVNSIHRLANDSYNAAYVGELSGTAMMLSVTVDNNSVTAQIILLAAGQ